MAAAGKELQTLETPFACGGIFSSSASHHCRSTLSVGFGGLRSLKRTVRMVNLQMLRAVENLKVFAAVVLSIAVDVVDVFAAQKMAPKRLLYHVSMLQNVSVQRFWMIGAANHHVPVRGDSPKWFETSSVVAPDKHSAIAYIPMRAWDIFYGESRLSAASALAQAIRRIPIWWRRSYHGLLLSFTGLRRIHLVAWNEVARIATVNPLKLFPASTLTSNHFPRLYQIGAI